MTVIHNTDSPVGRYHVRNRPGHGRSVACGRRLDPPTREQQVSLDQLERWWENDLVCAGCMNWARERLAA
ncbi:MAG: hypothetical protein R3253_05760 [Longimicrobiales bacterium]|nr:hypothetical protein [Longimicrobiales bacterium]